MSSIALTIIIIIAILIIISLIVLLIAYNSFQRIRINVEKSGSNIKVLLKQRFDEVPQLVAVCKQFIKHETGILETLTKLRTKFNEKYSEDTANDIRYVTDLNESLTESINEVAAVSESYPQLQSSEQFLYLQNRISSIEEQIADRREYYNESVSLYNTRLVSFPDFVFKIIFGYSEKEFIEIPETEHERPEINLGHQS